MDTSRRKHPYYRAHRALNFIYSRADFRALSVVVRWAYTIVSVTAGAVLILLQFPPEIDDSWGRPGEWVSSVYEYRFAVVAVMLGLQLSASAAKWFVTSQEKRRLPVKKVSGVLDDYVVSHFAEKKAGDHQYRATLFQVRHCRPFGGWLGVVCRSGYLYTSWRTIFSIDPNNKANNTGYAGECWRRSSHREGSTIKSEAVLPDVRTDAMEAANDIDYKKLGYLADSEYNVMAVKSRVFWATAIRVNGRVWGVLVLDSTDPSALTSTKQAHNKSMESLAQTAKILTLLIS